MNNQGLATVFNEWRFNVAFKALDTPLHIRSIQTFKNNMGQSISSSQSSV